MLIAFHALMSLGDAQLDKFRVEYEKLHAALKKSHDNERRLMNKCRELNAELVTATAKVSAINADAQLDDAAVAALRMEASKRLTCLVDRIAFFFFVCEWLRKRHSRC
jgi:septal ring factor EnvC (AmiA/AmiB activator)